MNIFLSLGCNIGNRLENIKIMRHYLCEILTPPFKFSRIMKTEPVGVNGYQPSYLNMIMHAHYSDDLFALWEKTISIEKKMGRTEKGNKQPRVADIDILIWGDKIIDTPSLKVPHREILNRRFIIDGICDIDPELLHPATLQSFQEIQKKMDHILISQKIDIVK